MTTMDSRPGAPPPGGLEARSADMHDDPRFRELRSRLMRFVVPASLGFLGWYLLYVVMSAYARDVLDTQVVGSFNLAIVFGLLQFVSTFGIAVWYSRYADRQLDPMGAALREELEAPQNPKNSGVAS